MFKIKIIPALLLAVLLLTSGGGVVDNTAHAAFKNLQITNHTGRTIDDLYLYSGSRGNETLAAVGLSTLPNGSSVTIGYNTDHTYYNLSLVFTDGSTAAWVGNNKINLSGAWRITIYVDGASVLRVAKN